MLAAMVADLLFSMAGPELVDRWFWMPFMLALCFRDRAQPDAPSEQLVELPLTAPEAPVRSATASHDACGAPWARPTRRRAWLDVGGRDQRRHRSGSRCRVPTNRPAGRRTRRRRPGRGRDAGLRRAGRDVRRPHPRHGQRTRLLRQCAGPGRTRSKVVAEVGCGRGAAVELDQPGGPWQDLRGDDRTVIGIDVEDAGTDNPVIDEFRLIGPDGRWPLDDASVDLAVSDYVLEHVTDPSCLRGRARPGAAPRRRRSSAAPSAGARCSRWWPAIVPNERHAGAVARLQPGREAQDVFHTAYKMNTAPGPRTRLRRRLRMGARAPDRASSSTSSRGHVCAAPSPPSSVTCRRACRWAWSSSPAATGLLYVLAPALRTASADTGGQRRAHNHRRALPGELPTRGPPRP